MFKSRNYAPSDDLKPFIRRHYVFEGDMPSDFSIEDELISETCFVRFPLRGQWVGRLDSGEMGSVGRAALCGANFKPFPVRVEGSFLVAGFAVRPSAWRALFNEPAAELNDRMVPLSDCWPGIAERLTLELDSAMTDQAMVNAIEAGIRARLAEMKKPRVDEKVAIFEEIARTESTLKIEDVADRMSLSIGQAERRVRACYGSTPKVVLRRSRFLELATAMRGLGSADNQHLAVLRYFDQSHINREFRQFAARNPSDFKRAKTPLFDVGLQLRVEGLNLK